MLVLSLDFRVLQACSLESYSLTIYIIILETPCAPLYFPDDPLVDLQFQSITLFLTRTHTQFLLEQSVRGGGGGMQINF